MHNLNDRHFKKQINTAKRVGIIFIVIWLMAIGGWIANIAKLVGMNFDEPITTWMVMRVIGVFAMPLGAILGYL